MREIDDSSTNNKGTAAVFMNASADVILWRGNVSNPTVCCSSNYDTASCFLGTRF